MKWEQAAINGKPQSHGIQCNDYRIGRFTVNGKDRYASYHAYQSLGFFDFATEAKAAAESHLLSLSRKDTGDE